MKLLQQVFTFKKMNKKIYFLFTFLSLFVFLESNAQFAKPFSIGFGGGGTILYADLRNKPVSYAGHIDLDALINPYISVGINGQAGKLQGDDFFGRSADNNYIAVNGNIKVRLGQFMDQSDNYSYYILSNNNFLSYLSNIYFGAGVGFISNDVDAQRRFSGGEVVTSFDGRDKSTELVVPINVGIDFPIGQSLYGPTWAINLNYQHGFSKSDDVDGYSNEFSKSKDHYSYFSLGVKIAIFNRK